MKLQLDKLELTCRKATEVIDFERINYFYGEMGAGKSTIARLIDYCLGSRQLVMTPALQSEFVTVALDIVVGDTDLRLERERDSGQVLATWGVQQVVIPIRSANGPVISDTKVEVLSDLIFHLNGSKPPRVRKSQHNEDSALERLSLRDLLWYCYLDQDSMDSSFFNLDREAENFRRLKSRNVLRSILGVHQEKVAELEEILEQVRRERQRDIDSANALDESLEDAQFSNLEDIISRSSEVTDRIKLLDKRIKAIRKDKASLVTHASDKLRTKARHIASEMEAVERTIEELTDTIAGDKRHVNEVIALSTKVRRLQSARAVLNDVDFISCPRCTQLLPKRKTSQCRVCGQNNSNRPIDEDSGEETQADIKSRISEIEELIEAQGIQVKRLRRRREDLRKTKEEVDLELNRAMRRYDSAYLAEAISTEIERAELGQEWKYLQRLKVLPIRVEELRQRSDSLAEVESSVRRELRQAREAAEQDLSNLNKLKGLFLDCLVRAKIPGFTYDDIVEMQPPWFLPLIEGASGEMATTSFSTLGSGGKKNLFKCCFALAVHRLSAEIGTLLPTLMIIDSSMKNISERENRKQFEAFHHLLYELADDELKEIQFILIDKEFCPPADESDIKVKSRHMRVDSKMEPPLISYYRG